MNIYASVCLAVLAGVVVLVAVPLLTPLAKLGLHSHPGGLNPEPRPVPLTGGPALFLGMLPAVIFVRPSLVLAFSVALVLGMADDLWDLSVLVRMAVWMIMGALIWLAEGGSSHGVVALVLVVVPAIVAGVNFLDGSDGLATAVVAPGLLGLAIIGGGYQLIAASGVVALAAFLVWNHPPARAYLGNSGATLLAAWLLAAIVHVFIEYQGGPGVVTVLLCVLIPLTEVATTVCRRTRAGVGFFARDRGHGYDRLIARGWSAWGVVGLYGGLQLGAVACAIVAYHSPWLEWPAVIIAPAVLIGVSIWNGSLRTPPADPQPNIRWD